MAQILIAGAGIVGVSTAIWAQRAGHDVTLIDRAGPASGTSHGNAGILASGALVPVTTPGIARKAPGMLRDRDAPLFLRWRYLPKLLPFLRRYLGHATVEHVDHYARAMSQLQGDSYDQHRSLADGTPAAQFVHNNDYCFGYATAAEHAADAYGWNVRAENGVRFEVLEGQAYADTYDDTFAKAFETVVVCRDHGRVSDPGAYVKALADHMVAEGGTLEIADITDVETSGDGAATALITSKGRREADHIILTLGAWSKPMLAKLGLSVPLESERGYHIEFMNPSVMPKNPMMVAAGKFVLTPMEGRLRAAGVVEFGGLKAPPSKAPFELLRRQVKRILPDMTCDEEVEWMGHRPAPADSLPIIGQTGTGTWVGFGHQHLGLTGGPKTGRVLADLISGRSPNLDLSAFDPKRYARS